jgi:hypothetical protein
MSNLTRQMPVQATSRSSMTGILQRAAVNSEIDRAVPPIVYDTLGTSGQPLDEHTRDFMERRFGHDSSVRTIAPRPAASGLTIDPADSPSEVAADRHADGLFSDQASKHRFDFSGVRVHDDSQAARSARAVGALAYAVGRDMVFGQGQYAPGTDSGRWLLAHELTHVIQQDGMPQTNLALTVENDGTAEEHNAEAVANAVTSGRPVGTILRAVQAVQRRAAPYIKKISVHLTPPQTADLEWEGTPPTEATGSDHFTVSTGKGYSDLIDPPGTCTRTCCRDANMQCAPPWNQPGRVGACCTYYGSNYWTGIPQVEHNTWRWWTPIQPYYSSRGIALHQHHTVTGQPIGHGCVRMLDENARRIYDYSNGRRTNVTIDGRAAPVQCEESQRCPRRSGTSGRTGSLETSDEDSAMLSQTEDEEQNAIPGLEGMMT